MSEAAPRWPSTARLVEAFAVRCIKVADRYDDLVGVVPGSCSVEVAACQVRQAAANHVCELSDALLAAADMALDVWTATQRGSAA